jgi:RHS repeat-associated protein
MGAVRDGWVFFQESLRLFLPFHSRPKPHLATSGLLVGLTLIIFSLAGCFNEVRPPIPLKSKGQTPAALSQKNWGELQKKLAALSYEINGSKDELWARDRQHGLRYHFLKDGLAIGPDVEKSEPKNWLSLHTLAFGRHHQKQAIGPANWQKDGDFRIERQSQQLTEWYVNSAQGLEQGYTVSQKPKGQGELWLEMELKDGTVTDKGDYLQLRLSSGRTLNYGDLRANDANGRQLKARFHVRGLKHVRLVVDDSQAVYPVQIDPTITDGNSITTVAGSDDLGDGGSPTVAQLHFPPGIAAASSGDIYIADNNRIRKVSQGIITTVAGNGESGFSGDGGDATAASLSSPSGVAVDASGDLYIADTQNHRIRKVSQGIITTVAGNGESGFSGDGGDATAASLYYPSGIAAASSGDIYIATNNSIRKVSQGIITTVAGNGDYGFSGDGGDATAASLYFPSGVAVDALGDLYIADTYNHRIRKVSQGIITTVAGNGGLGFSGDGGDATAASLYYPSGVAVDASGDIYIADTWNHRIRKVSQGIITTVAGNGDYGFSGDGGDATAASLYFPSGVAVDALGDLYIADTQNHRIRKLSQGIISTAAGGNMRDGVSSTSASLYYPSGVAVDALGDLYIADTQNHRIRKVSQGIITTVAGNGGPGFSGDGGDATAASLSSPSGVAVDALGDLYIADTYNHRIRKVSQGIITTVADSLSSPSGVAVDASGDIYIADTWNHRIRKVSQGIITTVAGNGESGFSGDGGDATAASLSSPSGVAVDALGDLYIADTYNHRIRKVSQGIITTVAGNGDYGFSGDGGDATAASLYYPSGVAVDASGDLYIADTQNHRIRKVSQGIITTVAGNGGPGFSGDGGDATAASLSSPFGVAFDSFCSLYIADTQNNRIRATKIKIPPVAVNDTLSTLEDTSATLAILINDYDVCGKVLTPFLVQQPAHGSVLLKEDKTFTYTPALNYNGNDSFTYKVNNEDVDSNIAKVSVTVTPVNDPPVAKDDTATTAENTQVTVPVLLNDYDVDEDALTPILVQGPSYGKALLNADKTITYTPPTDMYGTEFFTYKINDGQLDSGIVRVYINITQKSSTSIPTPPPATTPLADATSTSAAYVSGSQTLPSSTTTVSSLEIYGGGSLYLNSGDQLSANNIFVDAFSIMTICSGTIITSNLYNSGTIDVVFCSSSSNDPPPGIVGDYINNGVFNLDPGTPSYVTGSFTQTASGQTLFHIKGPTKITDYSFISVNGPANLQGAFRVDLIAPYVPAHGTKFQIFEASGGISTGAFTMDLPPDFTWEIVNTGKVIELTYTGGSVLPAPKNLGTDCEPCKHGMPGWSEGNPINAATGNKFQIETDFVGAAHAGLELRRFYNSQDTTATAFGANWRSNWQRSLAQSDSSTVKMTQTNGRVDTFTYNGTAWVSDSDVTSQLSAVMNAGTQTGWQLLKDDDSTELYTLDGRLSSVTDRAGNVTTLTYDSTNRLSTVAGPFQHKLIFGYNADNLISDVTLPDNKHVSYGYDAAHNLTSVTYPGNAVRQYLYNESAHTGGADLPHAMTGIIDENHVRFATYKYDANNRAISTEHAGGAEKVSITYNTDGTSSVKDALEHVHSYTLTPVLDVIKPTAISGAPVPSAGGKAFVYDANGNVTSHMDFNGNLDCHAYDLTRNLETARVEGLAPGKTCPADPATYTPAAGSAERVILTQWHPTFRLPAQITEPSGVPGVNRVTTFAYDNATGNLLTQTISAGALTRSWTYTYNSHGQVLTVDGPRTDVVDKTTFTYDPAGNLATITNALNQVSQITSYNANGFPLTIQDPNGLVTQLTYTPRGQIATRLVGQELTTYEYDGAEQLQKITLPDNSYLIYSYNEAHQLTGITDALGNHITYTPDLTGNIVTEEVFDPNQTLVRTKSHIYDEVNRLAQDIGALNQTTVYDRDDNGNITDITDPNHNATTRTFDALNRLATIIDPQNGMTKLTYNPDDSLATVTDPRDVATQYAYDGLGNQISVQSPDSGTTMRTFDEAGNVKTSTDARGLITTNTYDALNRLAKQVFGKNVSVTYAYDQGANGIGHLTTMTDPSGSTTWTYDQRGHVLTKKQKVGKITLTTAYVYDAVTGQLTAMTLPSGQVVNYQYDANGRPAALLAGATPIISAIAYEPFGPAQSWLQGSNATAHQRQFDLDGNLSGISFANSSISTTSGGVETIDLFRDPGSRITDIHDNTALPKTFGYDALDELISYANTSVTQNYDYDANGNRTLLTENANNSVYTIDPASNRLLKRSTNSTALTNYTLDEAGNLTNDGTRSFTIDARGKLASVKVGKTATNYDYNGFGERVQKSNRSIGTTLFTQDANGNVTGEYESKGKAIQETVYLGNLPVGVLKSSTWYYVNPDHLGTPHTITDGTGNPVWSWDRDPFGNNQPTGTLTYNLRFPGQYYDAETGLHHNGFRDYDPMLGRYIESDPIGLGGGLNTYAYVGGNTVNSVDTLGMAENGWGRFASIVAKSIVDSLFTISKSIKKAITVCKVAIDAHNKDPRKAVEDLVPGVAPAAFEATDAVMNPWNNIDNLTPENVENRWKNLSDKDYTLQNISLGNK